MSLDAIPLGGLFAATIVWVVVAILIGRWIGNVVRRRSPDEKESPVSAASASVLGLLAFILAITFGIVTNRYDDRKALVREEANSIRTAWLLADLLPQPDYQKSAALFKDYVDLRLNLVRSPNRVRLQQNLQAAIRIQHQLWDIAVVNGRRDLNSDVGSLYLQSLNTLIDLQASRVHVGLYSGIPGGIWFVLFALLFLSMIVAGYQIAIADSTWKSWAILFLAVSFSLVITLLVALDRPIGGSNTVSQQPLVDLRTEMNERAPAVVPQLK